MTVLRLKTLWSGLVEGKCLSINCRKFRPTLVRTVFWSLKQSRRNYSIKWSILKRAAAYTPGGKRCGLCLEEKLCILKAKGNNSLNTRSEFYAKCCHKEKFSACKFKPVTIDKPPRQRATVDIDESNTN